MSAMQTSAVPTRDLPVSEPPRAPPDADHPESWLPEGLRAFSHRDYRILWFTQLFSLTGNWMQNLAQSWLVLTLTDSATALGFIGVCQFGPALILGLPSGVLVDRLPKRRLLLVTQSMAAAVTGFLALMVVIGQVQLWQIYAAALALGVINALDMPARQTFVVEVVGKDDLANAIALNSALFNTTRVVGPALAGLLLATAGAAVCFVLNAISYLPVTIGLLLMRTEGFPKLGGQDGSPLDRLREGIAYARATPLVLMPLLLVALVATFGMNFSVWVPLLARDVLAIGASGFGFLMSSLGIGALAGALTLAFSRRRLTMRGMLGTALLFGAFEIALGVATGLRLPAVLAMVLIAGVGFAMSTTNAQANTTIQTNTPDWLRGRVMSIYFTVMTGSVPVGALLAGFMSSTWGAPAAVAFGGTVVASVGLAMVVRLALLARDGGSHPVAR
jgi:MFS family permease